MPASFLTAEWRNLAMLNYEVDPAMLAPLVPRGTELDFWNGRTYVSAVGFQFLRTRVLGLPIPFHMDFEEVNVRFYVRRRTEEGWRRGVVFIKEIVPRTAIAFVARKLYNENYVRLPMRHTVRRTGGETALRYEWFSEGWNHLDSRAGGESRPTTEGSEEAFITEHYWGYTAQPDGSSLEYKVEHPRWRVLHATSVVLHLTSEELYGSILTNVLRRDPRSAFIADGSEVVVSRGEKIHAAIPL